LYDTWWSSGFLLFALGVTLNGTVTLDEKESDLSVELTRIRNGQASFARLVARARRQPPLDSALKTDEHLVEGCMSSFIHPILSRWQCFFQTDSDSAIVKGIASLLCEFYSGSTPGEILSYNRSFLAAVGLARHLTANRRSGLGRLTEKIRTFAAAQREQPSPSPD
jgi:cysteine desulfuration protein SufE